jgi:LysM repeat protein
VSSAAQGLGSIQADVNGTKVIIGPVFTARAAASLADIALRFGTSVATLLKFNADLSEPSGIAVGQQICILPCKK